jgi:hypothetical protein
MKEDREFRKWYKKKVEEHNETPPGHVWENIQDELDIDQVWDRIDQDLEKKEKIQLLKESGLALAAAAAIIIFVILNIPSNIKNEPLGHHYELTAEKIEDTESAVTNKSFSLQAGSMHSENNEEFLSSNLLKQFNTHFERQVQTQVKEEITSSLEDDEAEILGKLNKKTALLSYDHLQQTKLQDVSNIYAEPAKSTEETKQEPLNFYVGASGEFGNSWLLSNKTLYSIRESPYSAAKPSRNNAFSLTAGFELNDQMEFQLETQISNNNGQIYKEYLNGNFVTNQIQLNYNSLKLLGRYQFVAPKKNIPVSHNFIFGTYGSYLASAYQNIESEKENIRSNYRNYDVGLILGYEVDSRIMKDVTLSTGARIDPGIINIYQGSENLPANFNKTYTSSISVLVTLKYHL